jgi:iron-sulfur cluster assembly accessory protein
MGKEVRMPIIVSEKAATQVLSLFEEGGKTGAALRLWIAGLGCSGFRYGMGVDDKEPEQGDQVFESNGVKIVIDSESMKYMDGAKVDYIEDSESAGFNIDNPNPAPQSDCNCGSSQCGVPAAGESVDEEGYGGSGSA